MELLIGEDAKGRSDSIEYYIDGCRLDDVNFTETLSRINVPELILNLKAENIISNSISKVPNNNKFSLQAFLLYLLPLSGHLHQELLKTNNQPAVLNKKSDPIMYTDISPYHYYKDQYNNATDNQTVQNTTTSHIFPNDKDHYKQNALYVMDEAEHSNITNKKYNNINMLQSWEERQYVKSSSNSYIEVDQEHKLSILVASAPSLITKGWKYFLVTTSAVVSFAGIYLGYKWIKETFYEKEIDQGNKAEMYYNNNKHLFLGSARKKTLGINNLQFDTISIEDLAFNIAFGEQSIGTQNDGFELSVAELQYDSITQKDSRLKLTEIVLKAVTRDFYNKYLYEYCLGVSKIVNKDLQSFLIKLYEQINNDLLVATSIVSLTSIGSTSYVKGMAIFLEEFASSGLAKFDLAPLKIIKNNLSKKLILCHQYPINWSDVSFTNNTLWVQLLYQDFDYSKQNNTLFSKNTYMLVDCMKSKTFDVINDVIKHKNFIHLKKSFLYDMHKNLVEFSKIINRTTKCSLPVQKLWGTVLSSINSCDIDNSKPNVYSIINMLVINNLIIPFINEHNKNHPQTIDDEECMICTFNPIIYTLSVINYQYIVQKIENSASNIESAVTGIVDNFEQAGNNILDSIQGISRAADDISQLDIPSALTDTSDGVISIANAASEITGVQALSSEVQHVLDKLNSLKEFIFLQDDNIILGKKEAEELQIHELSRIYGKEPWSLYPGLLNFLTLNIVPGNVLQSQILLEKALEDVQAILYYAENTLHLSKTSTNLEHYVKRYLAKSFGTENSVILNAGINRIEETIKRMQRFINDSKKNGFQNFLIASTLNYPLEGGGGFEFTSNVPTEKLDTVAFVIKGHHEIIIISELNQIHHSGALSNKIKKYSLPQVIVHEISHIVVNSYDLFEITPILGKFPCAQEALELFIQNVPFSPQINIIERKLQGVVGILTEPISSIVPTLLRNEFFRTNLLLLNADSITILIFDLAFLRKSDYKLFNREILSSSTQETIKKSWSHPLRQLV